MSDVQNLTPQMQSLLQIKLDGFIEACVHTSRSLNIGLTEALGLTMRALLREIAAHKLDPGKAQAIWNEAAAELLPTSEAPEAQRFN